jgi:dolichol-phosphate mannosyltransferase
MITGMNSVIPIKSVSIVMPTYNEAANIADLMRESVQSVTCAGISEIELIVVDDNSPDLTWKIASEFECPGADVRVIRRLENHGLTASLNDGIAAANKDVVVWLDCDFSHPPDRIPQMLNMVSQGFDIAVNSRYLPGGGEIRSGQGGGLHMLLSRYLSRMLRILFIPSFYDYTSGFVAARREVFSNFKLRGDYGEYFVDFIVRAIRDKKYRVCELPYTMLPRRSGVSKTGLNLFHYMKRGKKYLRTIMRLKYSS